MLTCTHQPGIHTEEEVKEFIMDWEFFLDYQEFIPEKLVNLSYIENPYLGVIGNNGRKVLKITALYDSHYGRHRKRKIGAGHHDVEIILKDDELPVGDKVKWISPFYRSYVIYEL
jgi:hypothetical protein